MPGEQVGSAYVTLGLDSSKFDSGMGQAEGKLRGFAGSMANILKVGAVAGGAAIAGAATLGIKSFVDYESGLYDIAKVTGMAGDELKGLGEGLRAMSLESGQAVTGLEAIAAVAGQMGIQGSADILKFTETVNQATVAFGIAPEAAAAAMGKIGNIWDIPTQELYKMGSAVNYLGNTTNASEAQLLDYMMAIGNQPRVLGMTSQETLLFGSTLVSMGMDASDAGTRLNAAFGQQGLIGHLPAAAKQLGVTEAALKGMIDADPTDTVLRLIDSMSGITSETERLQVAQEIFGAIGGKAIVPLIGRTDQFRASLGNVNTEYEKGTAMAEEYKTRWGALGVQLSRVRQGINDVAITIGEGLAPYVRGFADLLNNEVLPGVKEFTSALMSGDWDKVGDSLQRGIKYGWDKIKDIGKDLLSRLKSVNWSSVGDTVWKAVQGGLDKLKGIGGQVLTWLQGVDYGAVGTTIFNAISGGLKLAADYIKNYTFPGTIIQGLMGDWTQFDRLKTAFISVINPIKDAAVGLGTAIWDSLGKIDWKSMGETAARAIKGAIDTLSKIGDQIANWIRSGLKSNFSGDANSAAERIKSGFATLTSYWNEFKAGLTTIKWDAEGRNLAEKIKGGIAEITGWAASIIDGVKEDFRKWVDGNGPYQIGESIGHAIADGAAKLGKWIADKLGEKSTGETISAAWNGLLDWMSIGASAVANFVSGFAAGITPLGQTIYNTILEAVANALSQVPYLGEGVAEKIRGAKVEVTHRPSAPTATAPASSTTQVTYGPAGSPNWPGTSRGQKYGDWVWTGTEWINSASYNPKTPEEAPREMTAKEVSTAIARAADTAPTSGPTLSINEFRKAWLQLNPSGKSNQLFTEAPVAPQGAIRGTATRSGDKFVVTDSSGARSTTSSINDAVMMMARAGMAIEDIARTTGISKDNWEQLGLWKSYQSGDATWRAKSGDAANAAKRSYDLEKKKYDNTMDTYRKYQQYVAEGKILWDAQTGTWKWADKTIQDAVEKVERTSAAVTKSEKEAAEETKIKLIGAADYAARSLALGAEIGKKFTTDAGQSVVVSFDKATNKFAANIGLAGSNLKDGGDYNLQRAKEMGAVIVDSGATSGRRQTDAATIAGSKTTTAASQAASSINSGADQARAKIAAAGDVGTKLTIGAQYAASAIVSAGSAFAAAVRGAASLFSNASYRPGSFGPYKPSGFALGTKTTGPELAMIGEDGPSWPEFIIPTKTKRWDLLTAALRAYGVRGFAEGGSTGGASGGDASVGFSGSIIISIGKLNQAVVRALADIVNRFRTSWAVIKAETTKHWIALTSNTNAELSQYRSVVAQAMSEARTAVLSAWTDLLDRGKILWTEGRESMSQQAAYLADNIRLAADNTRIAVSDLWQTTKDEINNGIMEVQTVWQNGWAKIEADLATAAGNIKSKVQEIAALLKSISGASVNISVGGFIGGGGGGGGGRGGGGGFADAFINNYFSGTTCEIDELSGMSPGLIESLAKSGAWKPNENLASQMIAQAIGYGTSAKQTFSNESWSGGISRQINNPQYAPSGGASRSSSFSSAVRNVGGVLKIGKYDAGGISARPQIAVVSGQGEPELHLTKSNVREFLGDGGDRPMIIQVFLGDREVTDLVMKKAVSKMRTKGLQMG